jgi:hypothetical protein
MKTILLSMALCLTFSFASGQTKKEIMYELEDFARKKVSNKAYDVPFDQLWDAIYSVGNTEYTDVKRESKTKAYIEFFMETDIYRENLTFEVRGENQPYKVVYQLEKQSRTKNLDGSYTAWVEGTGMPPRYLYKLECKLYELIYGPIEYPASLLEKIEKYNAIQSKDKKKILLGRDY